MSATNEIIHLIEQAEQSDDELTAETGELARIQLESFKSRLAALEAQNKRLVEALEKIRDFDAKQRAGYVDEWEEAWAFSQCKTIANDLLTEVTK